MLAALRRRFADDWQGMLSEAQLDTAASLYRDCLGPALAARCDQLGVWTFLEIRAARADIRELRADLPADLGNLGLAYAALGEARKAIEYHEQALAMSREIREAPRSEAERAAARRGEGNALGNLGLAYAALGEMQKAIEFTEAALRIFEAIESPYAERARRRLEELRGRVGSG